MGLESISPPGRQITLHQPRTLAGTCQDGTSDYKIQHHPQAEPDIVHMDKLMPYYPDFGEELHSWIETDYPIRYRDQGEQTVNPALQSQLTAVVDIPPQMFDATPGPESVDQPPDPPNLTLGPDETIEANTAKSAETETLPVVMETKLDSTALADPEPSNGPSAILETETALAACPDAAPTPLLADQMDPVASEDSPATIATLTKGRLKH